MTPLAWAKPSPESPKSVKSIGDVLIVKDTSNSKLLVIAFDRDRPYLSSKNRLESMIENELRGDNI